MVQPHEQNTRPSRCCLPHQQQRALLVLVSGIRVRRVAATRRFRAGL